MTSSKPLPSFRSPHAPPPPLPYLPLSFPPFHLCPPPRRVPPRRRPFRVPARLRRDARRLPTVLLRHLLSRRRRTKTALRLHRPFHQRAHPRPTQTNLQQRRHRRLPQRGLHLRRRRRPRAPRPPSPSYQSYTQHVRQLNGLPLNLWLTPDLKPFEGANYLPPTEEWGKEGFLTVAKRAASGWQSDPDAQRAKADEALATIESFLPTEAPAPLSASDRTRLLAEARETWLGLHDSANGGFGDPPKSLEPELLRFLLTDSSTRDAALTTLRALLRSPVRDPLDGGFFRYASDAEFRQPYFQKTLSDQARIALALLDAFKLTQDATFASAARDALLYAVDHLKGTAVEDSTAEAALASHFFTSAEIEKLLGPSAAAFNAAHDITAEGNIPADTFTNISAGQNLPRLIDPAATPRAQFADAYAKLLAHRRTRSTPARDDPATAGTRGLLLAALSRAATELDDPRFASAASTEFTTLREQFISADSTLRHLPDRPHPASPLDYAQVIAGLLAHNTPDSTALARQLLATLNTRHLSPSSHYLVASPENTPAFFLRVRATASYPGEPIAPEPTLLLALASHDLAPNDLPARLAAVIAADLQDSLEPPRGDALLALTP